MEILAIFPKEVVCPLFIRTLSPFLKYNNKTCFIFIFFNKLIYCTIRVVESDPSYPVRFALKRNVYILQKKKSHNIPRDISKFVGKEEKKISQIPRYFFFFIINPICEKEIASKRSKQFVSCIKKEKNFLSKVSPNHVQSSSIWY